MTILTDYYRFVKVALKAKKRLDCVASTHSYEPFEALRATKALKETATHDATEKGALTIYYTQTDMFKSKTKRKADFCLSKKNNITSIYQPEPDTGFAFGDFRNTSDALLFCFTDFKVINGYPQNGSVIEVFVARGLSNNSNNLYNILCDGGFDADIEALREQARP